MAISRASHRIDDRTWPRVAPTARVRPISRVRSTTDRMSVFTIPIMAMRMVSSSRAFTSTRMMSYWALMPSLNSSRSCSSADGNGAIDRVQHGPGVGGRRPPARRIQIWLSPASGMFSSNASVPMTKVPVRSRLSIERRRS